MKTLISIVGAVFGATVLAAVFEVIPAPIAVAIFLVLIATAGATSVYAADRTAARAASRQRGSAVHT